MGFPKYQHLVPVFSGRWEEGVAVDEVMPALSSWGQVPVYRRQHRADPFPVQRRLPVGPEGEREEEGWDKGGRYREVGGGNEHQAKQRHIAFWRHPCGPLHPCIDSSDCSCI